MPRTGGRNRPQTFATSLFAIGGKYVGGWKDGSRYGQGTYTFADGAKYIGEFKYNLFNGQGIYTFSNGNKYVGNFEDGEFTANGFIQRLPVVFDPNEPGELILPESPASPARPLAVGSSIPLVKAGGVYKVPVMVNGVILLQFMVDSGASDVSIPFDVVLTMVRTGSLTDNDFVGEQIYRLADGSRIKSKTFRIRHLKVGDRVVENVLGSVADVQGSLLEPIHKEVESLESDVIRCSA